MFKLTRREVLAMAGAPAVMFAQSGTAWQSALNLFKGVHPRLMLDAQKLSIIRSGLNTTYRSIYGQLPFQTSIIRGRQPQAYTVVGTSDSQQWQTFNGDSMVYLALAFLLTGEASYLADCKTWALASCSYPTWGTGTLLNNDLAAGQQLFGLALVYDWLQGSLDSATLATIRQTMITRSPFMYDAAVSPSIYWSNRYIGNHTAVHITGLAAAAMALFDDSDGKTAANALLWLDRCRMKMQTMQTLLPPDGASLEGVTYWDLGLEYTLKFWDLSAKLLGENLSAPYFNQTPWYRIYLTLPTKALNYQKPVQVDIADCARTVWEGPSPQMRRLASIGRNPQAQWHADTLSTLSIDRYLTAWQNFLWYEPTIVSQGPAGIPTFRSFSDLGIVAARSDWSGNESLVVFKCGPPPGASDQSQLTSDTGDCGHAHPDANHFVIFGNGEFQIRDDGYLSIKKTQNHNTLLVNGIGQMGDGAEWFDYGPYVKAKTVPHIITAQTSSNLDYVVGEASPAYAPGLGVSQFRRHLLFVKPNALVVVDDIVLSQASLMEMRFHTENVPSPGEPGVFLSRGASSVLRTQVLTVDSVNTTVGIDSGTDNTGAAVTLNSIRLSHSGSTWRNVTAFSWDTSAPLPIAIQPSSAGYTVSAGSRRISFQWDGTPPSEMTQVPLLRLAQPAFGGNPAIGYASNGFVEFYGENLANQSALWSETDFAGPNAPQSLAGTQVQVNGISAYLSFVSPHQVNINLPQDVTTGSVELKLTNNGVPSNILTFQKTSVAPSLLTNPAFVANGKQYVVAFFPNSTQNGPFVGEPGLIPGIPLQSVQIGDRIILYVMGAGPTTPATQAGVMASSNAKVSSSYTLLIGGKTAIVEFFGIVAGSIGLYQLNAVIPNVNPGDQPIELIVAGAKNEQAFSLAASHSREKSLPNRI